MIEKDLYHRKLTLHRTLKLTLALTVFSVCLTITRMVLLANTHYAFLITDIILAWLAPATIVFLNKTKIQKYLQLPLWGIWLLSLPRAPYLVTELIHLEMFGNTWHWLDQIMLFSYALSGILITITALDLARVNMAQYLSNGATWCLIAASSFLCAVGIYLGKMRHWDSWDLLRRPGAIAGDILDVVKSPFSHMEGLVFWGGFGFLIMVCYSFYAGLVNTPPSFFSKKNVNQSNKYC